jgi:membrane protein DedA with SNARE-associated domain
MEIVLGWVARYGYLGLFLALVLGIVGLPIPDETLLTFAGYLAYRGKLRLAPAVASAILGSICGITLSYVLGRTFGLYLVHRYGRLLHITEDRLTRVQCWFNRTGRPVLTFGYFIPGIRHLTAYVAGASRLPLPVFALFAYSGGALWSGTFVGIGYFLGERWSRVGQQMQHYLALTLVVLLGVTYLVRRMSRPKDR